MNSSNRQGGMWTVTWAPAVTLLLTATLALALGPRGARANCGTAFCSLSTDWAGQGVWSEPGLRIDVRYEHVVQDTLWKGTEEVSLDAEEAEDEGLGHLERETINRNLLLTVDYGIDANWGLSVTLPWVDREHTHVPIGGADHHELRGGLRGGAPPADHGDEDHGAEGGGKERWDFAELGDARVVGRYSAASGEFLERPRTWGLEFGLKLPTGRFDVENGEGERAERTLQPGTGTTDLILGAFVSQPFGGDSTLFAKGGAQEPLAERSGYAPGTRLTLDGGYRYQATDWLGLMAQLNVLWKGKDRGDEAEPEDSGGTFVFVSPGAAVGIGADVQLYGFYQLPLYQDVNGIQLTADDSAVLGASVRF